MSIETATVLALSGIGGISCLYYHKRLPPVFLWLGIFLLFAMLSQLGGILINIFYGRNSEYYNVVIAFNFLLQYRIFLQLDEDSFYRTRIHGVFAIGAILIAYLLIRYFQVGFANRALTVLNIIVVIYALLYFFQMLRKPLTQSVYKQGKFWIATGFLVHHLSIFSFWLGFEFFPALDSQVWIYVITYSLTSLQYIILIIAIIVHMKFRTDDRNNQ